MRQSMAAAEGGETAIRQAAVFVTSAFLILFSITDRTAPIAFVGAERLC
jgi:hypothetical protein